MSKRKLVVVTAAWGDWHIGKYLDLNLPTLLAPGNLPALAGSCEITYLLHTAERDLERLRSSRVVQALARHCRMELASIPPELRADPIEAHHQIWGLAMERARAEGAYILNMPPDVAWSDGSFAHVGRLLDAGKKALFMNYLRVESESFSDAISPHRAFGAETMSLTGEQLVEISLHCAHPLMAASLRDSTHFPIHPEMMLWAVPGEGVLCRMLAREMFIYDPARVKLNAAALLETRFKPDEIHVIDDSDDLFAASLTPLDSKETDWYRWPREADLASVAQWWLVYDSWINDRVAQAKLRWHYRSVSGAKWRARERASDLFLRRAAVMREGRRLVDLAREQECGVAELLLAAATQSGLLGRITRGLGGATVFLPNDPAIGAQAAGLLGDPRALAGVLRRHYAPGIGALSERADDPISFGMADGTVARLVRKAGRLELDGIHVVRGPVACGQQEVYVIDGMRGTTTSRPPIEEIRA